MIRTFLAFRHIGSVLCVTDQVPWSQSRGGAVHCLGGVREYLRGLLRRMDGVALGSDAAGLLSGGAVSDLLGAMGEELMGEGSAVLDSVVPAAEGAVRLAGAGTGSVILVVLCCPDSLYILAAGVII